MQKKNIRKKKSGWAYTKNYPHKNHPTTYQKKRRSNDDIEYITFTHSPEVDFGKTKIKTIPLSDNISPVERDKNKKEGKPHGFNLTYVYPKVFVGKRSALGRETTEFKPTVIDNNKIETLFNDLPREKVRITSNSKKYRKKKKPVD